MLHILIKERVRKIADKNEPKQYYIRSSTKLTEAQLRNTISSVLDIEWRELEVSKLPMNDSPLYPYNYNIKVIV